MKEKVIVIEDDAPFRELLRSTLEECGYHSDAVGSAEEALLLMSKETYDVALTDIFLPKMDGMTLLEQIRQNYDTDVLVMTGYRHEISYEEAVSRGASDFVFKPFLIREIMLRIRRILRERRMLREQSRMLEKLKELSVTDGLTRLYNARHFQDQIGRETDRARRYNHPLALLYLDIDHFKRYNDAYGHPSGDDALIRIGQIIHSSLRRTDTAYRQGGEEFAVILPGTHIPGAVVVADRIRSQVRGERFVTRCGAATGLTISIGVTQYVNGEDLRGFIERADDALYASKTNGRNRVTVHERHAASAV